jgi:beta-phosphoglucomutase
MHWSEKFDLLLFDFDGLLVDTEPVHYEAYRQLCRRYGYSLPWDFSQFLQVAHSSSEGLRIHLHPHLGDYDWKDLYTEKVKIYLHLLRNHPLDFLPGVEALLEQISHLGLKRAVVTNSTKEQIDRIKEALPLLNSIPVWITREDYEHPKPAPDGYLKAIELLADPGDRIVGFEDSLKGINSLKQTAALPVLICDPSHPQMKGEEVLSGVLHSPSFEQLFSS